MNQINQKRTRKEKHAQRRAELDLQQRKRRRSLINTVIFLAGAFFLLRTLIGWVYIDFNQALWKATLWFSVPSLLGSVLYQAKYSLERQSQRSSLELAVVTLFVAFCGVLLGAVMLVHVNSWTSNDSKWISGIVVEKQEKRRGGRSGVFSPELKIRTNVPDSINIKVPWEEYRTIEKGDSLTIRMHTGRFGWKYARHFEVKTTEGITLDEVIDTLDLDASTE